MLPLSLFLLSCASNQVSKQVLSGTEKIVELYVPECAEWEDNQDRIGSILRGIEGVLDVKINTATYTATVTFAPEKTNIERLIRALEKERFVVSGSPKLLEWSIGEKTKIVPDSSLKVNSCHLDFNIP